LAGISVTSCTSPACRARCSEVQPAGPRRSSRGCCRCTAAAPATSAGRDRTRILTPDSKSPRESTTYGWKYSRLGRYCNGSLDRLVLGHLCTDRPQNAGIRIARTPRRTIGRGHWAAEHGVHTWGTSAKQRQVSHTRVERGISNSKSTTSRCYGGAVEATASIHSRCYIATCVGSRCTPWCALVHMQRAWRLRPRRSYGGPV